MAGGQAASGSSSGELMGRLLFVTMAISQLLCIAHAEIMLAHNCIRTLLGCRVAKPMVESLLLRLKQHEGLGGRITAELLDEGDCVGERVEREWSMVCVGGGGGVGGGGWGRARRTAGSCGASAQFRCGIDAAEKQTQQRNRHAMLRHVVLADSRALGNLVQARGRASGWELSCFPPRIHCQTCAALMMLLGELVCLMVLNEPGLGLAACGGARGRGHAPSQAAPANRWRNRSSYGAPAVASG